MSCVHYKFRSFMEYKKIIFEGLNISLCDLKRAIAEKEKIGLTNFDLQVTNAQTKLPYADDAQLVPRNSSVLVARIPAPNQKKLPKIQEKNSTQSGKIDSSRAPDPSNSSKAQITALKQQLDNPDLTEEKRFQLAQKMSTVSYDPVNYVRRGSSLWATRPPPTYTCNRCGQTGHWIKSCPETMQRRPTGMPREELVETNKDNPRAYLHPSGKYVEAKMHKQAYEVGKKERPPFFGEEEEAVKRTPPPPPAVVPEELQCQICKEPMRDAVLINCCGTSFCDECVRQRLLQSENEACPSCGETGISPDSLVPNKNTRRSVAKFVNETNYSYSNQTQTASAALGASLRNLLGAPPGVQPQQAAFSGLKISLTGGSKPALPPTLVDLMAPMQQGGDSPDMTQPPPRTAPQIGAAGDATSSPDTRSPYDTESQATVSRPAVPAVEGLGSSLVSQPLHDLNLPPPTNLVQHTIIQRPPAVSVVAVSVAPPTFVHTQAPPPSFTRPLFQYAPPTVPQPFPHTAPMQIRPRPVQPTVPPGVTSLPPRGPEAQPPPPGLADVFQQRLPMPIHTFPPPPIMHGGKPYRMRGSHFDHDVIRFLSKRKRKRSGSSESSYSGRSRSRSRSRERHHHRIRESHRHRRRRSRSYSRSPPRHRPRRTHRPRSRSRSDSRSPQDKWVPPARDVYPSSRQRNTKVDDTAFAAEEFIKKCNVGQDGQPAAKMVVEARHVQSHIPADPHVPQHSRYTGSGRDRRPREEVHRNVRNVTDKSPTPPPTPTQPTTEESVSVPFEKERSSEPAKKKESPTKKVKKGSKDAEGTKKVIKKKSKDVDNTELAVDKEKKKKKKVVKDGTAVPVKEAKKKRKSASLSVEEPEIVAQTSAVPEDTTLDSSIPLDTTPAPFIAIPSVVAKEDLAVDNKEQVDTSQEEKATVPQAIPVTQPQPQSTLEPQVEPKIDPKTMDIFPDVKKDEDVKPRAVLLSGANLEPMPSRKDSKKNADHKTGKEKKMAFPASKIEQASITIKPIKTLSRGARASLSPPKAYAEPYKSTSKHKESERESKRESDSKRRDSREEHKETERKSESQDRRRKPSITEQEKASDSKASKSIREREREKREKEKEIKKEEAERKRENDKSKEKEKLSEKEKRTFVVDRDSSVERKQEADLEKECEDTKTEAAATVESKNSSHADGSPTKRKFPGSPGRERSPESEKPAKKREDSRSKTKEDTSSKKHKERILEKTDKVDQKQKERSPDRKKERSRSKSPKRHHKQERQESQKKRDPSEVREDKHSKEKGRSKTERVPSEEREHKRAKTDDTKDKGTEPSVEKVKHKEKSVEKERSKTKRQSVKKHKKKDSKRHRPSKKAKKDKKKRKRKKKSRARSVSTSSSSDSDDDDERSPSPKKHKASDDTESTKEKSKDREAQVTSKSDGEKSPAKQPSSTLLPQSTEMVKAVDNTASALESDSVTFPSSITMQKDAEEDEKEDKLKGMTRAEIIKHAENAMQQKGALPRSISNFSTKKKSTSSSVVVGTERQARRVSMEDVPSRTIANPAAGSSNRRVLEQASLSITVGNAKDTSRHVLSTTKTSSDSPSRALKLTRTWRRQ